MKDTIKHTHSEKSEKEDDNEAHRKCHVSHDHICDNEHFCVVVTFFYWEDQAIYWFWIPTKFDAHNFRFNLFYTLIMWRINRPRVYIAIATVI